jgi:DNA modification methylase
VPTLNWIGKDAVVNHHLQVPFHFLKDVPELSVSDPGSGNLIVQDDNLVALKALLPYYAGQVKCIYIDPPYNTGNEGWIYNDNVNSPLIREWLGKAVGREAEDLSRHDKWLCMMYPRLALLRQFLREDGAIFVSLDDNEVQALRYIMDEIFGAQNFVVNLIWQKMDSPSSNSLNRPFSNYHDHTIVYARDAAKAKFNLLPKPEILDAFPEAEETGRRFRLRQLRKNGKSARRQDRPTMWYPITAPDGSELYPIHPDEGWEGRWAVGVETFKRMNEAGEIRWKKRPYGWMAYTVEFAPENPTTPTASILTDAGQNRQAKAQLNDVLGTAHGFDTPKPVGLVERVIRLTTAPGDLILDSFAGSGTTGHAVLNLNKTDDGSRRFILVEVEPKIARDITAERVKRVAQGYTNAKGEKVEGLGGSFRFCELGEPLFDEHGQIKSSVRFEDLARHVYFTETGEPLPRERVLKSPLIGECRGVGIYLLFNGILGDKSANGGNILTRGVLAQLPKFDGQKVIYCAGCLLGKDRLQAERIIVRQTPYEIKVS